MSESDLEVVLAQLRRGEFRLSTHAVARMQQRGVRRNDIREVGHTAYDVRTRKDGKIQIRGMDLDGDELTVICVYVGDTLVITVY